MANQSATKKSGQSSQAGQSAQGRGSFPLDNLTYDLVTILYEKSKGLEAYDKYLNDANNDPQTRELFEQMRQQDEQFVQQLHERLGLQSNQQS
jgi:hypothetical protein